MTEQRRGVLAVTGSSIAIFWAGAFIFGFPGVMGSYWQELFRVGRGAIGLTLFFVLAAVGIFMFFVGRFQEKLGTRAMITIGAIICGLDVVLVGYASELFTLYLWAFFMGMGSCFIYIPALTTVQKWFPARRGLVSGIVNFMFAFSAAVMSPLFHLMLNSMGYVPMCIALAIMAMVIGVVAAQFTEMPATVAIPTPIPQSGAGASQPALAPSLTLGESLRTRSFWLFWLTWAFQGAAGIAMVTLSTQFGLSLGLSLGSAVVILTAFNITNGLSRLLMGHLSDIVGRNAAMSVTFLAAAGAYFVLPHVDGVVIPAVLAAIIGFAFGTLFAVSAPLATDCFGLQHFGSIFGVIFTAYGFVAGPLGPWLSGYLLDATQGNFVVVFSYLGVCCVLSGIFIRLVIPPRVAQ
jgi:OFA family oxalate/formate antiporter-like MFS transporter